MPSPLLVIAHLVICIQILIGYIAMSITNYFGVLGQATAPPRSDRHWAVHF